MKAYERDFKAVIKDYKFKPKDLVLVRNTAIESLLDKKMKQRYLGPMIVVAENRGGSYILAEMTGAVWRQKVAKFRVVPYFARERINIPESIMEIIDLDREGLAELLAQPESDVHWNRDYILENIKMVDSDESDQEETEGTDDIIGDE